MSWRIWRRNLRTNGKARFFFLVLTNIQLLMCFSNSWMCCLSVQILGEIKSRRYVHDTSQATISFEWFDCDSLQKELWKNMLFSLFCCNEQTFPTILVEKPWRWLNRRILTSYTLSQCAGLHFLLASWCVSFSVHYYCISQSLPAVDCCMQSCLAFYSQNWSYRHPIFSSPVGKRKKRNGSTVWKGNYWEHPSASDGIENVMPFV